MEKIRALAYWLDRSALTMPVLLVALIVLDTMAPTDWTLQAVTAASAATLALVYAMLWAAWANMRPRAALP